MGSNKLNISNQILQSVDILVNKRISQLDFDKTIQATVLECIDAGIGKYKLSYQNSIIYAYSDNILQIYPDNTEVYVSIPQNDLDSEHKLITGFVKQNGSIAVGAIKDQDSYYPIGTDIISDNGEFGLCSYHDPNDEIDLYDVDNPSANLIDIDNKSAEIYLKDRNYIMYGAEFRTALDDVQKETTGNYGFKIVMQFCKNSYTRKEGEQVPLTERVEREYDFSSLSIPGQSNKLTVARKASVIKEIDGSNFIRVKKVTIYCKDYVHDAGVHANDIFISNLELFAMEPLTDAEKNANTLKIIIDESQRKKGYFDLDNNNVYLKAILKSKTKTVKDTEKVKFYWYLKNNRITTNSPQYNTWGGANWECLNSFEEDENGKRLWAPTGDTFELINTFDSNKHIYKFPSPINVIRCVALLGRDDNQERLVDEIVVRNEYNYYRVEITSTNGQDFYFDKGQTTLQARLICTEPSIGDVTNQNQCQWGYKDSSDVYYILEDEYARSCDYPVRDIPSIINYRIYSCAFYSNDGDYLGESTIKISNIYENQQQDYNLVLKNGSKVYKYDADGISPAAAFIPNPIAIDPITFSLFDKQGNEISFEQILAADGVIEWRYPINDTMIKVDYSQTDVKVDPNDSNYMILSNKRSFEYSIQDNYEYSKGNNDITLTVIYKDSFCPVYTTLAFIKDGAMGTNGTSYYCSIEPTKQGLKQVRIIKKGNSDPYLDEQVSVTTGNGTTIRNTALVAKLIKNGDANNPVKIAYNGYSEEGVRWYRPEMNQGQCAFSLSENGAITIDTSKDLTACTNNIIRVEIEHENYKHFTEYSIPIVILPEDSGSLMLSLENGFSYVQYETDGTNPKYNRVPFRAVLKDGNVEVSNFTCRWEIPTQSQDILIAKSSGTEKTFSCQPLDRYNDQHFNAAIKLTVEYNNKIFILIHSIQYYLDRYGKGYINDWDGNSIKIDNDNNYILAPQIGAGELGEDHSFTGITIGKSFDKGSNKEQIGLMGYKSGARSIFLDAKTGTASFGVSGQGQIILDPTNGQGVIRSGNYEDKDGGFRYTYLLYLDLRPQLDNNGNPVIKNGKQVYETYKDPLTDHTAVRSYKIINQQQYVIRTFYRPDGTPYTEKVSMPNGIGMSINLTEPSIKAGAGQFQISKNGKITTMSGQIAGWHLLKGLPFNESNLVDTEGIEIGYVHIEKQDRHDYPTVQIYSDTTGVPKKQIKILSSEDDVNKDSERKYGTTLQSDGSLYCRKLVARDSGVIGDWDIGNRDTIGAIFSSSEQQYNYDDPNVKVTSSSGSILTSQRVSPKNFVCLDASNGIYQLKPSGSGSDKTYEAQWALLNDGTCIFKKGYIAGWEINKEYLLAETRHEITSTDSIDDELQTVFTPQKNTKQAKQDFLDRCGSTYSMAGLMNKYEVKAKNISMSYEIEASLNGTREIKLQKDGSFINRINTKLIPDSELDTEEDIKGKLYIEIINNDGSHVTYLQEETNAQGFKQQYDSSKTTVLWNLTNEGGAYFRKLIADTGQLGGKNSGIQITKDKRYGSLVAGRGATTLNGKGQLITNKLYASGGQIANWTIDDDSLRDGTLGGTLNGSQIQEYVFDNPATHQFGLDKMKVTNKFVLGSSATIIDSSQDPETSVQMQFRNDPNAPKAVNFVADQLLLNGQPIGGGSNMETHRITLYNEAWTDNQQNILISGLTTSDVVFYYPDPSQFEAYVGDRIYVSGQEGNQLTFKRANASSPSGTERFYVDIVIFKVES